MKLFNDFKRWLQWVATGKPKPQRYIKKELKVFMYHFDPKGFIARHIGAAAKLRSELMTAFIPPSRETYVYVVSKDDYEQSRREGITQICGLRIIPKL